VGLGTRGWLLRRQLPSALDAVEDYIDELEENAESDTDKQQYWHEPSWFLLKGHTPIAVLDEAGYAHLT
jgi:hypothetical protein